MYDSISKKVKLGLVTGLSALVLTGCGVRKEESYSFHYKGVPFQILHKDIKNNRDEYFLIGSNFKVAVPSYPWQTLEIITDDNKKIIINSNELRMEDYKR